MSEKERGADGPTPDELYAANTITTCPELGLPELAALCARGIQRWASAQLKREQAEAAGLLPSTPPAAGSTPASRAPSARVAERHEQGAGELPAEQASGDTESPSPSSPKPDIVYAVGTDEKRGPFVDATIKMRDGWTLELRRCPQWHEPEWWLMDAYMGDEPEPEPDSPKPGRVDAEALAQTVRAGGQKLAREGLDTSATRMELAADEVLTLAAERNNAREAFSRVGLEMARSMDRAKKAEAEVERLRERLNTPELHRFSRAVVLEAAHQRERWGAEHDARKEPGDWFWLLGYLAGKALRAAEDGDKDKALHHTISSAAALANWHAALRGEEAPDAG